MAKVQWDVDLGWGDRGGWLGVRGEGMLVQRASAASTYKSVSNNRQACF